MHSIFVLNGIIKKQNKNKNKNKKQKQKKPTTSVVFNKYSVLKRNEYSWRKFSIPKWILTRVLKTFDSHQIDNFCTCWKRVFTLDIYVKSSPFFKYLILCFVSSDFKLDFCRIIWSNLSVLLAIEAYFFS